VYAVSLNLQNWSEMKWPILQLGILLALIFADAGAAIHDRYFTDKEHMVCISNNKCDLSVKNHDDVSKV
jgi:hypothetical protein